MQQQALWMGGSGPGRLVFFMLFAAECENIHLTTVNGKIEHVLRNNDFQMLHIVL